MEKSLHNQLIKLASRNAVSTKIAAKQLLKSAGLKQTLADDLLRIRIDYQHMRHSARCFERTKNRLGHYAPKSTAHCYDAVKPRPDTHTRLQHIREKSVLRAYSHIAEHHAHGDWTVTLTDNPANVAVHQNTYVSGRNGRWTEYSTDTNIVVPRDWRLRVSRRGLAVCDDIMTLDAHPLDAKNCELYSAVWARKTRGKTVVTERGYIAKIGDVTYHADSTDAAISGIIRKSRKAHFDAKLASIDLDKLVESCRNVKICIADAVAIGACQYGIRSWCDAVGIEYAIDAAGALHGCTTLDRVYHGYKNQPRTEARSAILRVLRRNRNRLPIAEFDYQP